MLDCLIQCLESEELNYQVDGERVLIPIETENASYNMVACLAPDAGLLIFYAICPVTAATPRRPRLAELCTRINFDLPTGTLELSYNTGEIRMRTSVDTGGTPLTPELCRAALESNLALMDHYLEAVLKTLYTNDNVAEILEALENPGETDLE